MPPTKEKRESESGAADESTKIVKRRSARLRRSSEESESESTPMPSNGRPPTTPQPIIVVRSARKTDQLGTSKATASNDIKEESESNELRYPMRARTTRRDSTIRGSSQGEPRDKRESQASSSGGALSKLGLINQAMRAHKDFKRLVSMCSSRWGKKYWLRKRSDPDKSVKDYEVDVEVETRKGEGYKFWDAMYAKAGTNEGYELSPFDTLLHRSDRRESVQNGEGKRRKIDYIVGTVMRLIGEEITKICLIKFTKYPVCSWEERKRIRDGNEIKMYRIRCFELDFIEIRLRIEIGDAEFEKSYPNRYLKEEKGEGDGGYVTNQRSLYHNDLRALESRKINKIALLCVFPSSDGRISVSVRVFPLYIEDWTDEPHDFESLRQLEFMIYLVNSPFVEDFIKDYDQLKDMKCNATCTKCNAKLRSPEHKHCCGISDSVDIDENKGEFKWCEKGNPRKLENCMHFECTENCACKERECKNRPVQRGRQHVLCIFREPGKKGWGVRAVSEIDKCSFVTEYIGEVNEEGMRGRARIYDFEMAYPCMGSNGLYVHEKLIISAGKMGNESRYFNHSCVPNMNTMTTIIERYGLFYNHVGFFTDRKILPGEELVFDYFPDNTADNMDISKMFPDGCICATSQCRWPPRKTTDVEHEIGWEPKPVKEEEEEEDGEGSERRGRKRIREEVEEEDEDGEKIRRKRTRDEFEDDLMMPVDEDFNGGMMRDENDNDGMDSDRTLVASPLSRSPRRRRPAGSDEKKESRMPKMEESGDEEEKEGRMEMRGREEKKNNSSASCQDQPPPRQASPGPSRLARKAVGTGIRGTVKRNGRIISLREEQEELRRRMARPFSPLSSLSSSCSSSSENGEIDSSSSSSSSLSSSSSASSLSSSASSSSSSLQPSYTSTNMTDDDGEREDSPSPSPPRPSTSQMRGGRGDDQEDEDTSDADSSPVRRGERNQ